MLRNGTVAPAFTLRDSEGHKQSLETLCESKVLVLHFFRGAFCPTSHRDLMNLSDVYERFAMLNAELVGISADSPEKLATLRRKLGLQMPLLADEDYEVAPLYEVYESEDGEGPPRHAEPALFIIDVNGKIAWSQIQSGPKGLASVGEIMLILIMMAANGGVY